MKYLLIGIGVLLFIIIIWYITKHNTFKKLLIKIEEADSGIDVALAKRYNTLTQMVEVVKGYVKHEKETLLSVINLRNKMSIKEKEKASGMMDEASNKILLLAENYPNLKASDNFIVLQKTLVNVEEHLAAARRMYNSNVSSYNQQIKFFPGIIVAKQMKLVEREFFKANNEEKEIVKVDIDSK